MNLLHTLAAFAALITGMMVGNELAVIAFFYPAFYGFPDDAHARAADALAARLGAAMPFWYALTLLSLSVFAWFLRGVAPFAFGAVRAAAVLMAGVVAFTVVYMVPINNHIAALDVDGPLPAIFLTDRAVWDAAHRLRVAALVLVFALLLVGIVSLMG